MVKLRVAVVYLIFVLVSIVFLLIYILGALRYLSDTEGNKCDMTYMLEQPQYVRIKLGYAVEESHPNYGLYAYGEGPVTDKLRNMEFTGIPVLFIPGNAGSHEQVQSLASISLRLSRTRHTPFHFDYFTVDLAEEYSALDGDILMKQADFVRESGHRILSLYRGEIQKVILIGYSMGGFLAEAALMSSCQVKKIQASILITLATPHTPHFALDLLFPVNYYFMPEKAANFKKMETTIISVGGGARDLMVTSKQIIDPNADLNVLTTAVPHLWKSMDHLSILWCKQLVLAVVKALFDSVDVEDQNPRIYNSSQMRLKAFNYHLTSEFAGEYLEHYEDKIAFDKAGEWIEISKPQFIFEGSKDEGSKEERSDSWTFLMIPIFQEFPDVSIDTIDLETKDWLFLCSASSLNATKICQSGMNISTRTKLFPTNKNNVRKGIDLDLEELRRNSEFTHIVVRIPNESSESPIIHIDSYSKESRTTQIDDTSFFSFSRIFSVILPSNPNIILKNKEGTFRHFVNLGIHDVVSFELRSVPPRKYENNDENFEHAVIELIEEEKTQSSTFISQIRLLSTKDIGQMNYFRIQTDAPATMKITLRPNYSYEIRISQGGIMNRLAIFVRDRWICLYQVLASFCLLIKSISLDRKFLRTRTTILITLFLILLLKLDLEAIIAFGCFLVFALVTCSIIIFFGNIYNFTRLFLTRMIKLLPLVWSEWLISKSTVFVLSAHFMSCFIVVYLILTGCGILATIFSVFLFIIKLVHIYKDYMEELLMASFMCNTTRFDKIIEKSMKNKGNSQDEGDADPRINILNYLILFITWALAVLPDIFIALVWAKTYNEGKTYIYEISDSAIMLCVFLVLVNWECLCFTIIPLDPESYWFECFGVNFHRILGWALLMIAGSKDPWIYQWTVPMALMASMMYFPVLMLAMRYWPYVLLASATTTLSMQIVGTYSVFFSIIYDICCTQLRVENDRNATDSSLANGN